MPYRSSQGLRSATVIAVGAKNCKPAFQAIKTIMKYFLPNLGYAYSANLFVSGVDELGAINDCQQGLDRAKELGAKLGQELSEIEAPLTTYVDCRRYGAKENNV